MPRYNLSFENVDRERNCLSQKELDVIRTSFDFPDSVLTILPSADQSVRDAPEGFFGLYYFNLYYGLRLPIPAPIVRFCNRNQTPLAQLNPNAFKALLTLHHLAVESGQKELTRHQVEHLYRLGPGNGSWVSFFRWDTPPLPLPDSVQGWKNQFFFVGGTGLLPLSAKTGGEMLIESVWLEQIDQVLERPPLPAGELGENLLGWLSLEKSQKRLDAVLRRRFPEWGRWSETDWYNYVLQRIKAAYPGDLVIQGLPNFTRMKAQSGKKALPRKGARADEVTIAVEAPRKKPRGAGNVVIEPVGATGSEDSASSSSSAIPLEREEEMLSPLDSNLYGVKGPVASEQVEDEASKPSEEDHDDLEGVMRHLQAGGRVAASQLPDPVSGAVLFDMGLQKLGEAAKLLDMSAQFCDVEVQAVVDAQRERLEELRRENDGLIDRLRTKAGEKDDAVQAKKLAEAELERVRSENAALREQNAEIAPLKAQIEGWERFSASNAFNGFETFRELAMKQFPAFDWRSVPFDYDLYESVCLREEETQPSQNP